MATFMCEICCSEYSYNPDAIRKTRKTMLPCTCPKCSYTVCKPCQTRYAKGECANCQFVFSRSFVIECLGQDFHKEIIVPNIIRELMVEQRINLETVDVQSTVAWMKKCQEIRKNSRFGVSQKMPPKPQQTGHTISVKYSCPIGDCRGVVVGTTCSTCNGIICIHCHEQLASESDPSHVCNEDAKLVLQQSKPCPKCYSLIYKIEGCNAMHCTSCDTRFDWITLHVNEQNSNTHYAPENIFGLTRNVGNNMDFCNTSNRLDKVPRDAIERYINEASEPAKCPDKLLHFLYTVTGAVREYKVRLFDEIVLTTDLQARTHDLRVQYLLKKITDKIWEQRVYTYYTQYKAHILHANIINVYLSITDGFQIEVRDGILNNADKVVYEDILSRLAQLTKLCNDSFSELHKDYPIDTSQLYIRNVDDTDETVLDDCGFYFNPQCQTNKSTTATINPDAEDIVLYDYQERHIQELGQILITSHFALDLSMLGAGKTFVAMQLYKSFQYKRGLIITPASMIGKWKELTYKYGLENVEVYSFNELSGSMGKNLRVGHLIRRADRLVGQGNVVAYRTTSLFDQYLRDGLFLIIDEIQNIKNAGSAQTRACKELICAISDEYKSSLGATKSRVLLISGSPIDKVEQTIQFYKTVGIMVSQELTQFNIGEFSRRRHDENAPTGPIENLNTGLEEIRTYCQLLSPSITYDIRGRYYRPEEECYHLFIEVIKPCISRAMVVVGNHHRVRKFNGMYNLIVSDDTTRTSSPCMNLLSTGIRMLKSCNEGRGSNNEPLASQQMLAILQKALLMIETAKIPVMVQQIRKKMSENPMCKIVLACNFTHTIRDVARELEDEFQPLILDGSVPSNKRQNILRPFQEPNLTRRLLIGNVHVLSSGIDLDDKDGSYPRVCFVSPNYNTIDLYQISYRFLRALDTKSDSEMYMLYVKNRAEMNLLSAIATKGKIMKDVTKEQALMANILFPCDFEPYVEPEPLNPVAWNASCSEIFDKLKTLNNI